MPGKHRRSPDQPSTAPFSVESDPHFFDEQSTPTGRHRGPDPDNPEETVEIDPESTSPKSSTWSLPTIPIAIPTPRRPPQPAWTAAAWCADMPQQNRGRGRHRAGAGNARRVSATGAHQLVASAPELPATGTDGRTVRATTTFGSQAGTDTTTAGAVRSVAILAAVATGAVVVGAQDEADASGATPQRTGGEHREVRIEPQSAPIPLPEVITLSRPAEDRALQALDAAVTRDARTFKQVGTPYVPEAQGDQVDRWIAEALGLMGLPMSLAPGVRNIVMKESGGDPNAINLWDSNARKGIPSQGLMQTIPATYRACVLPSLADRPITDPVANITAGVRAMIANHGVKTLADGGRKNSAGRYIGYGGGKVPGSDFVNQVTGQLSALPGLL